MAPRTPAQLAAERRYRATERGREVDRLKKRRERARHPKEAAATIKLLQAHGKRRAEERRLPITEQPQPHVGHEVAITKQLELRRLAAAIRQAEDRKDRDEIERLRREQSLLYGPAKKPVGTGIVGLTLDLDDLLLG